MMMPAYLCFLSGTSLEQLSGEDVAETGAARRVVAANIDHETARAQPEILDHRRCVAAKVIDEYRRGSRHVDVIAEQYLRIYHVEQLNMAAVAALVNVEREALLFAAEFAFRHEGVRRRRRRQRQHLLERLAPA